MEFILTIHLFKKFHAPRTCVSQHKLFPIFLVGAICSHHYTKQLSRCAALLATFLLFVLYPNLAKSRQYFVHLEYGIGQHR